MGASIEVGCKYCSRVGNARKICPGNRLAESGGTLRRRSPDGVIKHWVRTLLGKPSKGNRKIDQLISDICMDGPWNFSGLAHWRVPRRPPEEPPSAPQILKNEIRKPLISVLLRVCESPVRADRSVSPSEYDSCSGELK